MRNHPVKRILKDPGERIGYILALIWSQLAKIPAGVDR